MWDSPIRHFFPSQVKNKMVIFPHSLLGKRTEYGKAGGKSDFSLAILVSPALVTPHFSWKKENKRRENCTKKRKRNALWKGTFFFSDRCNFDRQLFRAQTGCFTSWMWLSKISPHFRRESEYFFSICSSHLLRALTKSRLRALFLLVKGFLQLSSSFISSLYSAKIAFHSSSIFPSKEKGKKSGKTMHFFPKFNAEMKE